MKVTANVEMSKKMTQRIKLPISFYALFFIETYCGNITNDDSKTLGSLQTKMSEEGSNGGCSRELHGLWNELGDGETDAGDGKDEKDGTLNHNGSNSRVKWDISQSVPADNIESELRN